MDLKKIIMSKDVDEHTFGKFVRDCREEKEYSVRTFAKMIGCSAAYLSDIEKGNRYAPKKYLDKIFEKLELREEDRQDFEDLAASTRGFQYEDINSYFGQKRVPGEQADHRGDQAAAGGRSGEYSDHHG